jgi:AraC-like DNA-binding protein
MDPAAVIPKELVDLSLAFTDGEGQHPTAIRNLQIVRSDGRTAPAHRMYDPSLCLVVQGEKEASVGSQAYRFGAGEYLMLSVDLPVTGRVTQASPGQPFLCLVLALEPATVYGIVKELHQPEPAGPEAKRGIYQDRVDPDLADAMLRLLRCLKCESDTAVLAPFILGEITYRLLGSPHGFMVRQLGVAGSRTLRIAKAVDWIRSHYDQPLRMEHLAKLASMSQSAFFQHFKQVTTLSPLRYQKELRLQEARRLLSTELADAATAAFRVGYESPSQFSREYARMFGLPPISDLKHQRNEASRP